MSTIETQALPTGTWSVDRVHSQVGFAVDYMAGTFTGTFSEFDASVADGVLHGSAQVASIQVKDPNLEAHLQSPDFFDAERHPDLMFRSNSIERNGDETRLQIEAQKDGRQMHIERRSQGGEMQLHLDIGDIDTTREPGMTDEQLKEKIERQLRARGLEPQVTIEGGRIEVRGHRREER